MKIFYVKMHYNSYLHPFGHSENLLETLAKNFAAKCCNIRFKKSILFRWARGGHGRTPLGVRPCQPMLDTTRQAETKILLDIDFAVVLKFEKGWIKSTTMKVSASGPGQKPKMNAARTPTQIN